MPGFAASGQDNLLMLNRSGPSVLSGSGIFRHSQHMVGGCVYSKNKSAREMQNVYSVKSNLPTSAGSVGSEIRSIKLRHIPSLKHKLTYTQRKNTLVIGTIRLFIYLSIYSLVCI